MGREDLARESAFLNTEYFGIVMDPEKPGVKGSPCRTSASARPSTTVSTVRKMMTYLHNSIGIPATSGFVPAGLPSFDTAVVKGYHYNIPLARQLLKEAGYPDGKGLPPIRLVSIPIYADLANYVAHQLQDIGIQVTVEVIQKGTLMDQVAKSAVPFSAPAG